MAKAPKKKNKKGLPKEELREFKNGKYMGGPAEERAEKKKTFGKRMAGGGMADTGRYSNAMAGRPEERGMAGRTQAGARPQPQRPQLEQPPLPPSKPMPQRPIRNPVDPLPPVKGPAIQRPAPPTLRPGTYNPTGTPSNAQAVAVNRPAVMPAQGAPVEPQATTNVWNPQPQIPTKRLGGMPKTGQFMRKGGVVKSSTKRMAKGGLVKGAGAVSKGIKKPRYC